MEPKTSAEALNFTTEVMSNMQKHSKKTCSSTRRKMKLTKATGPDSISVENLEALKIYGIYKMAFNEIYNTGNIPPGIF